MKRTFLLVVVILSVAFSACSDKKAGSPEKPALPVYRVGAEPIEVRLLEQDSFNIPYWIENGAKGRVLVRIAPIDGLRPVGKASLDVVTGAVEKGDVQALRALGDFTSPSGPAYAAPNTVHLAHTLGIVDEVYWVIPLFGSVTEKELKGFKDFLERDGQVKVEGVDTLKLNGNIAEGTINGVPVKLVGLQDLPHIDKPVLLQINASFLSELYANEKDTRILALVSGFFKTLKESGLSSDMVTVSISNEDGLSPVRFRFLAGYLARIFKDPAMIDSEPPVLWAERAQAWKVEQKSPREAVSIYRNIIKNNPADPASRYDLSNVYFEIGDLDACRRELAEAARLDPGYRLAYRQYAARLVENGNEGKAEAFLALADAR